VHRVHVYTNVDDAPAPLALGDPGGAPEGARPRARLAGGAVAGAGRPAVGIRAIALAPPRRPRRSAAAGGHRLRARRREPRGSGADLPDARAVRPGDLSAQALLGADCPRRAGA